MGFFFTKEKKKSMADYTIYKESKYDKHILKSGCRTYNARS